MHTVIKNTHLQRRLRGLNIDSFFKVVTVRAGLVLAEEVDQDLERGLGEEVGLHFITEGILILVPGQDLCHQDVSDNFINSLFGSFDKLNKH